MAIQDLETALATKKRRKIDRFILANGYQHFNGSVGELIDIIQTGNTGATQDYETPFKIINARTYTYNHKQYIVVQELLKNYITKTATTQKIAVYVKG